jgi:hypothetical protein
MNPLVLVCVAVVFAIIAGVAFLLVVPLLRRDRRAR